MLNQISEDDAPTQSIKRNNYLKIKDFINESLINFTLETTNSLDTLKNSLKEMTAINEARILYFKTEIKLGQYQIDLNNIAEKMMNL